MLITKKKKKKKKKKKNLEKSLHLCIGRDASQICCIGSYLYRGICKSVLLSFVEEY